MSGFNLTHDVANGHYLARIPQEVLDSMQWDIPRLIVKEIAAQYIEKYGDELMELLNNDENRNTTIKNSLKKLEDKISDDLVKRMDLSAKTSTLSKKQE